LPRNCKTRDFSAEAFEIWKAEGKCEPIEMNNRRMKMQWYRQHWLRKRRPYPGVSQDTVVGRIGAGFRLGDNASLEVEHGDLLVHVSISVHERDQYDPDFAFDDDEDFNFDDEDLDEDRK
jgi:hypothetical protein